MKTLLPAFLVVLAAVLATSFAIESEAARSSKPKEIVVVGSKVKDVVRSAGLTAADGLIKELDKLVKEMIRDAAHRARANGRKTLRPYDLSCLPRTTNPDLIVMRGRLDDMAASGGFRSDGELVQAVSDKVHEILESAIFRCTSNGRSTVRPYDL